MAIAAARRPSATLPVGGWPVLAAYALVAAATQMVWLTYAAITTDTAHRYGVSVGAVGWLAELFPLVYVVLALPAGWLLDRWFHPVLVTGALLVALGALVRLGGETFAWALAGQIIVAIAQPVVLSAVGKLAAEHLSEDARADGISLGSAGNFVGMLLALVLGPTLGADGNLTPLLVVSAAFACTAAIALAGTLRRASPAGETTAVIGDGSLRALLARPTMTTLTGLVFLGFGVFIALATWLQTLLHPDGVSDTAAGALLVGMVIAGVVGCAMLPPRVARRHAERAFMRAVAIVTSLGCVALAALPWLPARAAVLVVMGALLLPALPIVLTAAERIAGRSIGMAGAVVWMAGNLGGLVVAGLVQALVHHQLAAFLAMAAVSALALPLAGRLPRDDSSRGGPPPPITSGAGSASRKPTPAAAPPTC